MNFLLKHLLNYFLFAGTLMFAAGAVADVAGGADAGVQDDAGAAAGSDDASAGDGADAGAADGGAGDDAADKAGQQDGDGNQDDVADKGKLDARTLPASIKTAMTELQKTDPKAHAWLKDRLWAEKKFRDAVPGGLEEVTKLQTSVTGLKELAGPQYANAPTEQVVNAIKTEVSEWRQIDTMLEKGDANVLATIAEQFPEGFKKLLPVALSEFAARDLPNYQKHMAGIIHSELQSANVLPTLAFVTRLLAKGDVDGAKAELASVSKQLGQYAEIAAKKIDELATDPKLQDRETQLNSREHQVWVNEASGPINREKTSALKLAVQQYVPKGETLDDETMAAIEVHVNRFLDPLLAQDPNFAATFKQFEQNHDAEGMKKFILGKVKELLPSKMVNGQKVMGPAEKAVRLFFRGAPKPAPKPANGQQPRPNGQQAAPKGWEKLAADKAPQPWDIDKDRTPFEMSMQKAAILKNGKKVFWGDKAPA